MKNDIEHLVNDFLRYKVEVQNKSMKTYYGYRHDLIGQLLPFLKERSITDISELTKQDVEQFLAFILSRSETRSSSNANRKLAAIKSFLEYLDENGIAFDKNIKKIKSAKKNIKPVTYLTEEEKDQLMQTIEREATPFYKIRDLAIIKLFLTTGIRVSELTCLRIQDIEFHSKGSSFIYVKRKGGNEQQIPLNSKAEYALKMHLAKREKINTSSFLFVSRNNEQLDANSVYALVKHYLNKAGIHKRKWGPHILRHTVGVSLRRTGTDLATIQNLLGHKNLETTSIYLNVEHQDVERAVQSL